MTQKLTLFTSRNSLALWDEVGILSREMAIYQALSRLGLGVNFISYGHADKHYQSDFPEITILDNHFRLPQKIYPRLIPWLHRHTLQQTDVIKTNQMKGAKFALAVARTFNKPLILRQGYSWSHNVARGVGDEHPKVQKIYQLEQKVYAAAAHIVVTSQTQRDAIAQRVPAQQNHITVIPNYVDEDIFKPAQTEKTYDLLYVGRLTPEKNILLLLKALHSLPDLTLCIIGQGPQTDEVMKFINHHGLQGRITPIPRVPNRDLPAYFNQARCYILPSQYEGHPKTLIEAMMCGCAVIGTDVTGIRDVIQHGQNGLLCQPTIEGIAQAIQHLLSDSALQNRLGEAAHQFAMQHYALSKIAEQEFNLIQKVINV